MIIPKVLSVSLLTALYWGMLVISFSWAGDPCPPPPTSTPSSPGHVVPDRPPQQTNTPRDIGLGPFDGENWKIDDLGLKDPKVGDTVKIGGTEYVVGKDGDLIPKQEWEKQKKLEELKKKSDQKKQELLEKHKKDLATQKERYFKQQEQEKKQREMEEPHRLKEVQRLKKEILELYKKRDAASDPDEIEFITRQIDSKYKQFNQIAEGKDRDALEGERGNQRVERQGQKERQQAPRTLVRGDEVVKSGRTVGVVQGDVPVEKNEQWLCKGGANPEYYKPKYLKVKDPEVKKVLQEMLREVETAESRTVKAGVTGFDAEEMGKALWAGKKAMELQQKANQYFSTDMNKPFADADARVTYEKVNGFPEIVVRNAKTKEAYVISW